MVAEEGGSWAHHLWETGIHTLREPGFLLLSHCASVSPSVEERSQNLGEGETQHPYVEGSGLGASAALMRRSAQPRCGVVGRGSLGPPLVSVIH